MLQLKQNYNGRGAFRIYGDRVMRETVGSLKAYFIIVAVLGLIGNVGNVGIIASSQINPLFLIISLTGLAFSVAYLYIGIMLRKLLIESPKLVNNVILASMAYLIINFLLTLLVGFQTSSVIQLAIGLLITWYLFSSVKRLSQEEKSKTRPE